MSTAAMASTSNTNNNAYHLSRANPADAPALQALVTAAYTKYIPRIGRPPAPMNTDYAAVIASPGDPYDVHILRAVDNDAAVVGAVILADNHDDDDDDAVQVDNLVVDPSAQGRGFGRVLMGVAEARARETGKRALTLYTNEKMVENLGVYAKMGFVEVDRRVVDGYSRVFFRKNLAVE